MNFQRLCLAVISLCILGLFHPLYAQTKIITDSSALWFQFKLSNLNSTEPSETETSLKAEGSLVNLHNIDLTFITGNGTLLSFRTDSFSSVEGQSKFEQKSGQVVGALGTGIFNCTNTSPFDFRVFSPPIDLERTFHEPKFLIPLTGCSIELERLEAFTKFITYQEALDSCQNSQARCDFIWVDNGADEVYGEDYKGDSDDFYMVGYFKNSSF